MEQIRVDWHALPPGRACLQALIIRHVETCASLSRLLGRKPSYLGRYLRQGSPKHLKIEELRTLAAYFRVSPWVIDSRPREDGERTMAHPSPNDDRYHQPAGRPAASGKPFADWLVEQKSRNDRVGKLAKAAAQDRGFPKGKGVKEVWERLNLTGADDEMMAAMEDAELDFAAY